MLLSQQLISFVQLPNELINSELDSLVRKYVRDDKVIPSSDQGSFFAESCLHYECTVNRIIRWLNLLTIIHQYPSMVMNAPTDMSIFYPLQFFSKDISSLSKHYNYNALAKEDDDLEHCPDLMASILMGANVLLNLLNQAEQESDMVRNEVGDVFIQRVDSSENPCVPFVSLFSSFFITFTGKGHCVLSLPNDLLGFTSFAKQAEDVLRSLKEEIDRKSTSHSSKRLRVSSNVKSFYEEALRLHALFSQKVEQWSKAETAAEKNSLLLEVETLKTLLVEQIAKASHSATETTKDQFDVESACGVMHDAFSQLALYLHYAVPPSVEGLTLLDRYFLTAVSGIRLFYTFAIQQACLVILMNSQFHKLSTPSRFLPPRSSPVFGLRASSRRPFAPFRPVDAT